ncbi:hypothetical protein OV450_1407 [Actinobacteria bacterium OV450]|nr:hypothetical protein OV450_1407 [Actinobacteria bacterium OV450]
MSERQCVCRAAETQAVQEVHRRLEAAGWRNQPAQPAAATDEPLAWAALVRRGVEQLRVAHMNQRPRCATCRGYGKTPCHWRPCPDCAGTGQAPASTKGPDSR